MIASDLMVPKVLKSLRVPESLMMLEYLKVMASMRTLLFYL